MPINPSTGLLSSVFYEDASEFPRLGQIFIYIPSSCVILLLPVYVCLPVTPFALWKTLSYLTLYAQFRDQYFKPRHSWEQKNNDKVSKNESHHLCFAAGALSKARIWPSSYVCFGENIDPFPRMFHLTLAISEFY